MIWLVLRLQTGGGLVVGVSIQQIGEISEPSPRGSNVGQPVLAEAQMRPRGQARPNGIQAHITERRGKVRFVHRDRAEAALLEMPGPTPPCVDDPRIAPMNTGQRPPKAISI